MQFIQVIQQPVKLKFKTRNNQTVIFNAVKIIKR